MNNHRMCKMVFDTLSKSSIEKETLGKGDRVTFEYYLGRYELHQLHFRKARDQLLWCFNNCHIKAQQQQRSLPLLSPSSPSFLFSIRLSLTNLCRLILIYLITSSLPLGIFPSPNLLNQFSLTHIFNPIIQSIKQANFELLSWAFMNDNSREWLRYMGIWIVLQERLETLCWRVFIRKM